MVRTVVPMKKLSEKPRTTWKFNSKVGDVSELNHITKNGRTLSAGDRQRATEAVNRYCALPGTQPYESTGWSVSTSKAKVSKATLFVRGADKDKIRGYNVAGTISKVWVSDDGGFGFVVLEVEEAESGYEEAVEAFDNFVRLALPKTSSVGPVVPNEVTVSLKRADGVCEWVLSILDGRLVEGEPFNIVVYPTHVKMQTKTILTTPQLFVAIKD